MIEHLKDFVAGKRVRVVRGPKAGAEGVTGAVCGLWCRTVHLDDGTEIKAYRHALDLIDPEPPEPRGITVKKLLAALLMFAVSPALCPARPGELPQDMLVSLPQTPSQFPAGYGVLYHRALTEDKPLIVFVGTPATPVPGAFVLTAESFPDASGPTVVAGCPVGGELMCVYMKGPQTVETIRQAVFRLRFGLGTQVKAGGCTCGPSCPSGGGCCGCGEKQPTTSATPKAGGSPYLTCVCALVGRRCQWWQACGADNCNCFQSPFPYKFSQYTPVPLAPAGSGMMMTGGGGNCAGGR